MKPSLPPASLHDHPIRSLVAAHQRASDPHWLWLEQRDDAAVRDFLKAANSASDECLAPLEPLADELYNELLTRQELASESLKTPLDAFVYWTSIGADDDYPVWKRHPIDAPDKVEVLLDMQALSLQYDYLDVGEMAISPDESLLAWTLDPRGDEHYDLYIQALPDGTPRCVVKAMGGEVVWAEDNRTLLFTRLDAKQRSDSVWLFDIQTSKETLLFRESDDEFSVGVGKTRSRQWLVIESVAKESSESHLLDARAPHSPMQCVKARRPGVEYSLDHRPGVFYLLHNATHPHFQLDIAPEDAPSNWQTWLEARDDTTLEGIDAFSWGLVISERDHHIAQPQLRMLEWAQPLDPATTAAPQALYDYHTNCLRDQRLPLSEAPSSVALDDSVRFTARTLWLDEESFVTPPRCVAYDIDSGERTLLKQQPLHGDVLPEQLVTQRLWATASDGERIPVSVVMHRDAQAQQRPLPTLLYGYGAYGDPLDPWFSVSRLALLKRGIAFAVAHVRGGGERGEPWYHAGKLEHKERSFSDFLSAREALIDAGISAGDRVVAAGASAGGLLVAACLNRAPEAFCGALLDVPFVDVLRTMQNPELPLTTAEYQEWGNPAQPAALATISSYSPLDNLSAQRYPALYIQGSWHDARVPYWEPAKLFARINQLGCATGPVTLRTDLEAGHGGVAGRYAAWRDGARQDAFVVWALLYQQR
ncbi:S9 family peptidase [Carnimonas bestiolae]|uniref:S9 family peptidase n=1 Tax=Carnimonas bestiolae TaxID=3402172 RepID=UPI003EDC8F00